MAIILTAGCVQSSGPLHTSIDYTADEQTRQANFAKVRKIESGRVPGGYQKIVDDRLADTLIDPDSRKVRFGATPFGGLVCGDVNAKNRMGGYTGREPMVAVFDADGNLVSLHTFSEDDLRRVNAAWNPSEAEYAQYVGLQKCGVLK